MSGCSSGKPNCLWKLTQNEKETVVKYENYFDQVSESKAFSHWARAQSIMSKKRYAFSHYYLSSPNC